jgi:hypothetical protein
MLKVRRPVLTALLFVVAGPPLAPIWTVQYPPLVDYPNHLASTLVIAHLRDTAFHFSQFYSSDWNMIPYQAMYIILLGLQRSVSIDLAGRLLLSLCVPSVPAAALYFLHRANPGQESLALRSLLVSNKPLFFFTAPWTYSSA